MSDLADILHERILDLHLVRRSHSVRKHGYSGFYGQALTLPQAHVLMKLDRQADFSINTLAELLNVDQSTTSRVIKILERDKFVQVKSSKDDGRSRRVSILKKGATALKHIDSQLSQSTAFALGAVSKDEVSKIGIGLNALAEGFRAEMVDAPRLDSVSIALRRLTPAYGLVGGQHLGKELKFVDFLILRELINHRQAVPLGYLTSYLPYDPSAIRRAVKTLVQDKLIVRTEDEFDKRAHQLEISVQGGKVFRKARKTALGKLSAAAKAGMSERNLKSLVALLDKAMSVFDGNLLPGYDFRPLIVSDERGKQNLRRAFIGSLGDKAIPGKIFSDEDFILGVFNKNEAVGGVSIQYAEPVGQVVNLFSVNSSIDSKDLLESAAHEFFRFTRASTLDDKERQRELRRLDFVLV